MLNFEFGKLKVKADTQLGLICFEKLKSCSSSLEWLVNVAAG